MKTAALESPSRTPSRTPPAASRGLSLAILALSATLSALGTSIANVALPALSDAFSASFGEVQWIVLAYLIAVTALVAVAGRLGDRVGRKRLFLWGIILFTLASAACAAAPTLPFLIAARAFQGAGAAIMMALTLPLAADTAREGRTGTAIGLLGTMSAVGTALGPALGGLLLATLGWRAIFLLNLPLGLLALTLAARHLPADQHTPAKRGTGAIPLNRLRNPDLSSALAMNALVMAVMMATLVVGPFHLARTLHLGPAATGLAMAAGPLVAALSGLPAGRLVDRSGPRRATLLALSFMAPAAALLALAPPSLGALGYVAPLALLTAGYALFQAAANTRAMASAAPEIRGFVSGLLTLSRNIGLIAGASAMGALFAAQGLRTTFLAAAALVCIALAIAAATARFASYAGGARAGETLTKSPK